MTDSAFSLAAAVTTSPSTRSTSTVFAASLIFIVAAARTTLAMNMTTNMNHHDDKMFRPLSCNANLTGATPCIPFSSRNYNLSEEVEIPCGVCIEMDYPSAGSSGGSSISSTELTFEGGINIVGRLYLPPPPPNHRLKIVTPYVFVQGELSIDPPDVILPSPTSRSIEFVLTGTEERYLIPHHENHMACDGESGCKAGKKPVAIAGGRLDIRGIDDDDNQECPSWVRLHDVRRAPAPRPAGWSPVAPQQPTGDGCSSTLIDEDFTDVGGNFADTWDGFTAPTAVVVTNESNGTVGDPYYSVSDRTASYQGPRINLSNRLGCIVPEQPYLFSLRYRLHRSDGAPSLAETVGGSYIPWLKMIRVDAVTGGNDWISPTLVHKRGAMGKAEDGEWHDMQYAITFTPDQVDEDETSGLYLYLNTLDRDVVVDVDDVKLELAPPESFPATVEEACSSLLYSSGGAAHAFPYHASGGMLASKTLTASDVFDDGFPLQEGDPYLSWTERASEWSTASQTVNPGCMVAGAVYIFHAYVRILSGEIPRSAEVQFWNEDNSVVVVANCPDQTEGDGWVLCENRYTVSPEDAMMFLNGVTFHVRIPSDATSEVHLSDLSFEYDTRFGAVEGLVPDDASVRNCWGAGGEVLVTSDTLQWDDGQVAVIESVDATTGEITLVAPIGSVTTLSDDPMAGVEVALLSRNVRFVAEDDDAEKPITDGHGHGGHVMVMHTPDVDQMLSGVEVRGFGQQGNLGRYPIHFHMCNSVAGSVVQKNVIRDSNQRCVVIHNSDDVLIRDNVAFNTSGHCFLLEDGGEQNNMFENNLGASTRPVRTVIKDDESDDVPSTFWITNPVNSFVGNVAAGSAGPGFWFEVKSRIRGPSRALHPPEVEPRALPLKMFYDNVSHSNSRNGLQTYPQDGYRPPIPAVFRNHRSYKNRMAGVFFHAGGRLHVDGGYFADNSVGVDIDQDHSDAIVNTVIVGRSEAYRAVVEAMGNAAHSYPARTHCRVGQDDRVVGVRLDSYFWGGTRATGTTLDNVTFSGFGLPNGDGDGGDESCVGSSVLDVNTHGINYFDPRNSLRNVHIVEEATTTTTAINLCPAEEYGIVDVAIRDHDGSVIGYPGFIVSDSSAMTADARCTSSGPGTCASYCPGLCLRSVTVAIPTFAPPDTKIEITGTDEGGNPIAPHVVESLYTEKDTFDATNFYAQRRFFAYLPAGGNYVARFRVGEGNETIWPGHADVSYEDAPATCGPEVASLTFEEPQVACTELIVNGDAGDDLPGGSANGWMHIDGDVQVAVGGAGGTSHSLLSSDRHGSWVGLAQYLDTRCIVEGMSYNFRAKIKLTNGGTGTPYECNLHAYPSEPDACPRATVRSGYGMTDATHEWTTVGTMSESDGEWNAMVGTFLVSSFDAGAGTVGLYISGAPENVDVQIDQVSLVPVTESPTASPTSPPPTSAPISSVGFPPLHPINVDTTDAVSFGPDGVEVTFETDGSAEAVLLTKHAHVGVGESADLAISVQVLHRTMFGSGYQAALALFFAPEDATVDQVVTNDNGYANFESFVVATVRDKLYPTIDHVWTGMHAKLPGGTGTGYQAGGDGHKNLDGHLRLERSDGFVLASYSRDGSQWKTVGGPMELPPEYKTSPLKIGMRIKREWKSEYSMDLLPAVTSGGTV